MPSLLDQAVDYLESLPGALDRAVMVIKLKGTFPSADQQTLSLAVDTYLGRRNAPERLGEWAREGFFTRALLEQASRDAIAKHRAQWFRGAKHTVEIGSGSGSDTAALAEVSGHVTTIDLDPTASEVAKRNLSLRGFSNVTFLVGDAREIVPTLSDPFDALFADPARRREDGVRVKDASEYLPPLEFLLSISGPTTRAIKVSPGLFVDPLPQGWSREFIGTGSECLDQTLWFGSGPEDLTASRPDVGASWAPPKELLSEVRAEVLQGWLLEPHALINRTGRVGQFLAENSAEILSSDVPLGVSGKPAPNGAMCSSFRILDTFSYQRKRLSAALADRKWTNRTEFKRRSFRDEPEVIRAAMKLPAHAEGAPFGVVFLLKWQGKPWVVLCERV